VIIGSVTTSAFFIGACRAMFTIISRASHALHTIEILSALTLGAHSFDYMITVIVTGGAFASVLRAGSAMLVIAKDTIIFASIAPITTLTLDTFAHFAFTKMAFIFTFIRGASVLIIYLHTLVATITLGAVVAFASKARRKIFHYIILSKDAQLSGTIFCDCQSQEARSAQHEQNTSTTHRSQSKKPLKKQQT